MSMRLEMQKLPDCGMEQDIEPERLGLHFPPRASTNEDSAAGEDALLENFSIKAPDNAFSSKAPLGKWRTAFAMRSLWS